MKKLRVELVQTYSSLIDANEQIHELIITNAGYRSTGGEFPYQ
jgi:hypothetical protein